jgi:microcystin-dependent protein
LSERFRFFDSIDGEDEREYTADEFAEYFRQFIRNGIFTGGENLQVSTDEKDMKVFIKPGYAFIEGYLYKIDTEPLVIQHNIADPSLNRIDRIVIRLDRTLENRYVKAFILEGTPAEIPQVPELTRNNNIYEISLAQVEIIAGKSFIESYQITDERLNNDVCGIATHLFEQVDTTDIFNEWMDYLITKRNESNQSYTDFVTAYQNTWNSWIDEKISEPSGEFYAEWKDWFNELQDTANLVTKSQFETYLADSARFIPPGLISMWAGLISDIPTGWALCDGTNGTPDLRDRFIMGATSDSNVGEIGGENEVTLTVEQMPVHTHSGSTDEAGNHRHEVSIYGKEDDSGTRIRRGGNATSWRSVNTDYAGIHSHILNIDNTGGGLPHENKPAYYALAFIMKV